MWDEDELTWHDRLSRTHLSAAQTFADLENSVSRTAGSFLTPAHSEILSQKPS